MGTRRVFRGFGRLGICSAAAVAAFLVLPVTVTRAQSSGAASTPDQQAQAQSATAQPNLSGTWKLNEKQSDDPREKMREAMSQNASQGAGAMRPGRQGRRLGRGGGMMAEFSQLTINQTDKVVKVTGSSGRLIATSEPPSKDDENAQDNGGMMRFSPAEAKWQGSQLVAASHGFGGGTTTRTFELSPDGKQLYVTTKIENQRFSQPVTFRLVYDPVKSSSQ